MSHIWSIWRAAVGDDATTIPTNMTMMTTLMIVKLLPLAVGSENTRCVAFLSSTLLVQQVCCFFVFLLPSFSPVSHFITNPSYFFLSIGTSLFHFLSFVFLLVWHNLPYSYHLLPLVQNINTMFFVTA